MAKHRIQAGSGLTLAVVLCSFLLRPGFRVGATGPDKEPLKITGIQAKLFFDSEGTFSEDVLANPNFVLWNTPVGGGSAGTPSNSTLVLVQIAGGPAGAIDHGRQVSFTANYKHGFLNSLGAIEVRDVEVKQSASIGFFGRDGKSYVGFWLYDTGCSPVSLTAQIVSKARAPAMEKTIGFKCGE